MVAVKGHPICAAHSMVFPRQLRCSSPRPSCQSKPTNERSADYRCSVPKSEWRAKTAFLPFLRHHNCADGSHGELGFTLEPNAVIPVAVEKIARGGEAAVDALWCCISGPGRSSRTSW